jgi:S-methylmethionine-dependent homocysteine/selenocysteine methylase
MYHFILKETLHTYHQVVKSMHSFEEYLEWVIKTKKPYTKGATKFQKEMVTDEQGHLIVDFIGRFENLEPDFQQICNKLNIKASLPSLNTTVHKDYKSYYNDKTRQMVAEHFKADIEFFGYTFEG